MAGRSSGGIEVRSGQQSVQQEKGREEVRKATGRLKAGNTPGVDGIILEMLKCGGEAVVKWMLYICNLA